MHKEICMTGISKVQRHELQPASSNKNLFIRSSGKIAQRQMSFDSSARAFEQATLKACNSDFRPSKSFFRVPGVIFPKKTLLMIHSNSAVSFLRSSKKNTYRFDVRRCCFQLQTRCPPVVPSPQRNTTKPVSLLTSNLSYRLTLRFPSQTSVLPDRVVVLPRRRDDRGARRDRPRRLRRRRPTTTPRRAPDLRPPPARVRRSRVPTGAWGGYASGVHGFRCGRIWFRRRVAGRVAASFVVFLCKARLRLFPFFLVDRWRCTSSLPSALDLIERLS